MKKQIVICACLSIAFWLSGCGTAAYRNPDVGDPDVPQPRVSVREGTARVYKNQSGNRQNGGVTRSSGHDRADRSAADRARSISDAVVSLDGIEKASVVITGNTAIVGIEPVGEISDEKMLQFKTEVEEKVRATDSAIDHVAVTASGDLVKRIQRMSALGSGQDMPSAPDSPWPAIDWMTHGS